LHDLSPLSSFANLEVLHCIWSGTDITALSSCPRLKELHIKSPNLEDLSPLASCTKLEDLDCSCCTAIKVLSPLAACSFLRRLSLTHSEHMEEQVLSLRASHPTFRPTVLIWRENAHLLDSEESEDDEEGDDIDDENEDGLEDSDEDDSLEDSDEDDSLEDES